MKGEPYYKLNGQGSEKAVITSPLASIPGPGWGDPWVRALDTLGRGLQVLPSLYSLAEKKGQSYGQHQAVGDKQGEDLNFIRRVCRRISFRSLPW
jgi:hypothetical protein